MTRIFTEDGQSIPVTVIEASPNRITQIKTDETDGYTAVQVTAGTKRAALDEQAADRPLRESESGSRTVDCGSSALKPRIWATLKWAAKSKPTSSA